MPEITDRFDAEKPFSCAQGRHGELIIAQGHGVRPARWSGDPEAVAVDAGMDAPAEAPEIEPATTKHYYVARVDVTKPGACYYEPPALTFSSPEEPDDGFRAAKGLSYLSQAAVSEVRVLDGGKYYDKPPSVSLSDSYGKFTDPNGLLAVLRESEDDDPNNDPYTGISQWKIVSAPGDDNVNQSYYPAFNGRYTLDAVVGDQTKTGSDTAPSYWNILKLDSTLTRDFDYTVTNTAGVGSGARFRLTFGGARWRSTTMGPLGPTDVRFDGATQLLSVEVIAYGKDYSDEEPVVITIPSMGGESPTDIVIEGYTAASVNNTAAPRYQLKRIKFSTEDDEVVDRGSGFVVAPQLKILSNSGFGAYATTTIEGDQLDEITVENPGGGYKTPPTVQVLSGGAEVFAVSRPHLRGVYQCYCRFIDDTPEDAGGPLPSNLSPVTEVDVGEGVTSLTWTLPELPDGGRAAAVELWRTTSNQATTLYRVHTGSGDTFVDDLTDDELRDPNRSGYEAMPIILPNGELNANRFGIPPSDKEVVVRFQDRHWYAVDTSGEQPNTILFSEIDEPDSVPDANELVVQQNSLDADSVRALVPFGASLFVFQSRHAYSLTFVRQPLIDGQLTPVAYRGIVNQRTWAIHAGVCYVLDESGLYSIDQSGAIKELASPIADVFRSRLSITGRTWWFVSVDPRAEIVRAFVSFEEDSPTDYPTRALCYSIASQSWWMERYPQRLTASATARLAGGDFAPIYAGEGGCYLLGDGVTDAARGAIVSVQLTNGGTGYRTPPKVSVTGGCGGEVYATIDSSGSVSGLWIASTGFGYSSGDLTIDPPNDPDAEDATAAEGSYIATGLEEDWPLHIPYEFKTGSMEYPSDLEDPKASSGTTRNVRILYKPQGGECVVAMRVYYDNSPHPRGYLVSRDRGAGFVSEPADAAARLDMGKATVQRGSDSGVASALFTGRLADDFASPERNVAVEISGAATAGEPVVLYRLDVAGTAAREQR
jgi:hypothetical protein